MLKDFVDTTKSTVKGPSELKLSITIDPSSTIADLKAAVAAKSDVEKERQRLIYSGAFCSLFLLVQLACMYPLAAADTLSGKVLKDEETVASYKIATGHTIHMVKTQPPAAAAPAAAAAARLPTTMGTGLASGNMLDTVENHHVS
jgi:ubiquilin